MNTIQGYQSFISEYKIKIREIEKNILRVVFEKIIPGIKDILDDYRDDYSGVEVNARNFLGNNIDIDSCRGLDSLQCIVVSIRYHGSSDVSEFPSPTKTFTTKYESAKDQCKEIIDRILSEFGEDITDDNGGIFSGSNSIDIVFYLKTDKD